MSKLIIAALLLCSLGLPQAPAAAAQQLAATTLVVPGGTLVPLTLVEPIKRKSARPGDSIRAVVAFPVIVDSQVAIPAGTYVEGTLAPPLPKVKHQPDPDVQLHLSRLVFARGYTIPITATQAQASLDEIPAPTGDAVGPETANAANSFVSGQNAPSPTLPTLHSTGPTPALLGGVGVGVIGVITTIGLLNRNNAKKRDYIVHDAGWQFQMKLEAPLVLDLKQISLMGS